MAERYRELFLHHGYATFLENSAGEVLDANLAAARLLERTLEEIVGHNHKEFLAATSLERLLPLRQTLKPGQRLQFDAQYLKRNAQVCSVILELALLAPGAEGSDELYVVVARETSKLDELERELRLQRQSAHAEHSNSQQATFYISARNEICPYPPLSGNESVRPLDWVHALLLGPRLRSALEQSWKGQEVFLPPAWYSPQEARRYRADEAGSASSSASIQGRWLKLGFSPMRGRGGEITDVCVHVLDCTGERLNSEAQRRIDQRVSSALLTATLHHEMNNYLSVILAHASALRLATAPGQLPPPHIGAVIDAAQNAASLLRQAADISHHGGAEMSEVGINSIVADCAFLLPHEVAGRLSVDVELAPDVPSVRGDASALKTMVLELLYHAALRILQGGRMTIKTSRAKPAYAGMPEQTGILIQDNTPRGTAAPQIASGLETSEPGENLQLALARAILRQHRGQLEIVHSASQGRLYEVLLPGIEKAPELTEPTPVAAEATPDEETIVAELARASIQGRPNALAPVAATASKPASLSKSRRRVLIADDEENFRSFISWVLKERGYEVLVANDGQEAFERFQESPQSFNLVILDAYMPRMGGLESYLRMQVLRPDLPVLFASGFVRGATADALLEGCPGPADVILKPFSSEDLIKSVEKALTPAAE